jgi:hypothetical protein
MVNKLINLTENNLKKKNKKIYLTYDDILGMDKYNNYNYIAVKSNEETSPEIKVLNEDDLPEYDNKYIDINNFEENYLSKINSLSFKNNPTNNYFFNEFNPFFYGNKEENNCFINDNNKFQNEIKVNNLEKEKPIDLFLISQENQFPFLNVNNNIINDLNPFRSNNSDLFLNNTKMKESDFPFINAFPNFQLEQK